MEALPWVRNDPGCLFLLSRRVRIFGRAKPCQGANLLGRIPIARVDVCVKRANGFRSDSSQCHRISRLVVNISLASIGGRRPTGWS